MKKSLLTLIIIMLAQLSHAQLNKAFTQYSLMPYMVNAAASGMQSPTDIKLVIKRPFGVDENMSRDYFLGINHGIVLTDKKALYALINKEEAPPTSVRPVKLGVSGYVRQTDFNAISNTNGALSLAVHIPVSKKYYLAFGLSATYNQLKVNTQNLIVREIMDTYYSNLTNSAGKINTLDLGSGLMLYSSRLLVGYSVNGLASTRLASFLNDSEKPGLTHLLMAGYKIDLGGGPWEVYPSVLVRYQPGVPIYYNISTKFTYSHAAWFGLSYMSGTTLAGLVGFDVSENLLIGYSYDLPLGSSSTIFKSTNEITLGFKPFVKTDNGKSSTSK